ncbi:MAG: DUF4160 domain-containing protein [Chloroflexota bacterium]|nr:DUF4160 domain-containing protein [Chloroflexota bacterium]MDE3103351.1 DUF4160 domain-containing protein [Chloroflexota bacterium]
MPFIRIRGYLFGFYVSEPANEPPHIHVKGRGGRAKLWLDPVEVEESRYSRGETGEIVRIVHEQQTRFMEAWRERFGDR